MAFQGSPFKDYSTVNGRIEGHGKYEFPDGTTYTGEFKDGRFHGAGVMEFVNGVKYTGHWTHGETAIGTFTFSDGLVVNPDFANWDYCRKEDRRFYKERIHGIQHSDPLPDLAVKHEHQQ